MLLSHPSLSLAFSRSVVLRGLRPRSTGHRRRPWSWSHLPSTPAALRLSLSENHCSLTPAGSPPCPSSRADMDGRHDGPPPGSGCLLVLCGKGKVEKDQARSLAAKGSLKLKHDGDEIAITLRAAEGEESSLASPEETFRTQMYMEALTTSRFGGFLLWSPCLPSTQDVVSQ